MKFGKIIKEISIKYKPLKEYTKEDIISLLPKYLFNHLKSKIGIENIKFEIPLINLISISFSKNIGPMETEYFKNIRWKDKSDKNEYRYLLSIKTDILNDEVSIDSTKIVSSNDYNEIIKKLKDKGFFGIVDKLKRHVINIEDAKNELEGNVSLDSYKNIKDPRDINSYEIARNIKKQNIDRQSSYSYYVKYMSLKPKLDAKEWFKIYDEI